MGILRKDKPMKGVNDKKKVGSADFVGEHLISYKEEFFECEMYVTKPCLMIIYNFQFCIHKTYRTSVTHNRINFGMVSFYLNLKKYKINDSLLHLFKNIYLRSPPLSACSLLVPKTTLF